MTALRGPHPSRVERAADPWWNENFGRPLPLLPECRPHPYAAICRAMTMDRRRGRRDGSEHAVQRWRAMSEPGAIPACRSCFDPIMEMHIPIS